MHKKTNDNKFIITLKIAGILCSFAYTNNFESPRFTFCRREFFIVSAATQNSIESLYLGTNANAIKQHNTGKYCLTERESNSRFSSFMSFSLLPLYTIKISNMFWNAENFLFVDGVSQHVPKAGSCLLAPFHPIFPLLVKTQIKQKCINLLWQKLENLWNVSMKMPRLSEKYAVTNIQ